MSKEGKRCVIYVRVSTENQVDGFSLDAQRNNLKRYVEREGMILENIYEDAGKSGKSIEGRPAFKKLLKDIENGLAIEYVLVYKLSRFGRNAADILNSIEFIQSYDINLIAAEEGIDSSQTSGKLLISVLSAVSEIERENILEQTMNGRKEKARQGGWNGGFAPYGYQLVNGELLENPEESPIIREIFKLYTNDDLGYTAIAKELNIRGCAKTIRGNGTLGFWQRSAIRNVLNNPIYIGKIAFGRRQREKIKGKKGEYKRVRKEEFIIGDGKQPALIDINTWNKAQNKINVVKANGMPKGLTETKLLSGIMRCPICGAKLFVAFRGNHFDGDKVIPYYEYGCYNTRGDRNGLCHDKRRVDSTMIEPYIIDLLKNIINNTEFVEGLKKRIIVDNNPSQIEKELKELNNNLLNLYEKQRSIETKIDEYLIIKGKEKLVDSLYDRLDKVCTDVSDCEERIKSRESRLNDIKRRDITPEKIVKTISEIANNIEKLEPEEKRELIEKLIARIDFNENGTLSKITFKFKTLFNGEEIRTIVFNKKVFDEFEYNINDEIIFLKEHVKDVNPKRYVVSIDDDGTVKQHITYKMIIAYVKEKYGFGVSSNYVAEVKRKNGLKVNSDIDNTYSKHPSDEVVLAIEDAFRHFAMI